MVKHYMVTASAGQTGRFLRLKALKIPSMLTVATGLFLLPVTHVYAVPAPTPAPLPCAVCKVPEPSAIPEFVLCLAGVALGYWLWQRKRKPVQ
jgi:hypothetical protein